MQSICVFCGSNTGIRSDYAEAAGRLGQVFAQRGLRLVYGGAAVGLMGILADAAMAAGASVVGVIPQALVEREIAHPNVREIHTVNSMHERKKLMSDLADGFLALPGGAGTLEEFFEIWTWGQLGHHKKPVGLLNVVGFFDPLLVFLDWQCREGFMRREHREMLLVDADASRLLDRFDCYEAPVVEKWIGRKER
jgi:uncharacterized protein (TIGR00730 family)